MEPATARQAASTAPSAAETRPADPAGIKREDRVRVPVSAVITTPLAENLPSSFLTMSTAEPEVSSGMLRAGGTTYSALNMPSSPIVTVYMLPFAAESWRGGH